MSGALMLHLEKFVPARRERVFEACVDHEQLAAWWGPTGFASSTLQLDARAGGGYRIRMQPPDGDAFHLRGEFVELDPPRRLAYTFEWEEPDPDDRVTVATLSFHDQGAGTRVVLGQGPFATEARRALHEAGWTQTLDRLEQFLSTIDR